MTTVRSGLSLAATAAIFAMSAVAPGATAFAQGADAAEAKVHCYGVNTCKGTSDCKTAKSECKGMNDCKGHGFKELTAKQCKVAGGSLTEPK
jgi:uncharacterized membrane protein